MATTTVDVLASDLQADQFADLVAQISSDTQSVKREQRQTHIDLLRNLLQVEVPTGGGGSGTYLGLTDTPASFVADEFVKVNGAGTAIERVHSRH